MARGTNVHKMAMVINNDKMADNVASACNIILP